MTAEIRTNNSADWSNRFYIQKSTIDADQVEFEAFINGSSSVSTGIADERIADALDEFDNLDEIVRPEWSSDDSKLDNAVGRILEELQRRKDLLGNLYPFSLNGSALKYSPSLDGNKLYEALLCISRAESLSSGKFRNLPRHFENISCIVCEIYLGSDSASYRTGWPRDRGEPTKFKDVVSKLRALTGNQKGEWHWHPIEGLPDDPLVKDIKECGLDVVAWKPSIDNRTGQLYIIGQCACGKNWISAEKLSELSFKGLDDWVRVANIQPIKAFFTPWHATNEILYEASRKAGLFFDRVRMVMHAADNVKIQAAKIIIDRIINIVSRT